MFSRKPPRPPKKTATSDIPTNNIHLPKYVAQGTYGCVMSPAASCIGDGSTIPNAISKIFNNQESQEEEIAFQNKIQQLDPEGEYTVKKLQECPIRADLIPKTELVKCENLDPNNPYFWQIIYEYGGDDLQHIFKDKNINITFEDIFKGIGGILKGLVKLNQHRMVHQDIKPANILYNTANAKCYLIDFGLLTDIDSVYDEDKQYIITYNYDYYPPEFKFFSSLNDTTIDWTEIQKTTKNIPQIYDDVNDESLGMLRKYVETILSNYLQFHSRVLSGKRTIYEHKYSKALYNTLSLVAYWHPKNLKNVRDFTKKILSNKSIGQIESQLQSVSEKIDIYMLGITILEVFVKMEELGRVNMQNERFIHDVIKWMHKLLCFNPFERATAKEALIEYQRIISRQDLRTTQTKIQRSSYQLLRKMPEEPKILSSTLKPKSVMLSKSLPKRSKTNSAPAKHAAFIKKQLQTLRTIRRSPYNLRSKKGKT